MTIERPMFPPRAESVDSFPYQPGVDHGKAERPASESLKPAEGLSRRHMLAALAILPTAIPAAAEAEIPDAELIALGAQFEPLVEKYYAARVVWGQRLAQAHAETDERFGKFADYDKDGNRNPNIEARNAFFDEMGDRLALGDASDRLDAIAQELSPIANAILALPVTSIEGLRAKAMVAFREVAPLFADGTQYHFGDEPVFQRLFYAVAQVCGLVGKVAATGYVLPWSEVDSDYCGGEDDSDDEEDA